MFYLQGSCLYLTTPYYLRKCLFIKFKTILFVILEASRCQGGTSAVETVSSTRSIGMHSQLYETG